MKRTAMGLTALLVLGAAVPAAGSTLGIGNDAVPRTHVDTYSNFTIVDTNRPAEATGHLTEISYYAGADRPLRFVLVDGTTVKWVSDELDPAGVGVNTATFDPGVPVKAGWNLAVYSAQQGVVTFDFAGEPSIWTPNNNGLPAVGSDLTVQASHQGRIYSMGGSITPLSTTIVPVTENNLDVDWFTTASTAGGSVAFVESSTSPYGGAVQLSTDNTNAAKANLAHPIAPVPLDEVTELGYHTYQEGGPELAAASYQLFVTFDDGSWTWLVYEPYWQNGLGDAAPVASGWQEWDDLAENGLFWSSREAAGGGLQAGAGGPPFYTLSDVVALGQGATVQAIALNVGSYNPDWIVLADGMTFGTFDGVTVYDFEPAPPAPGDPGAPCKDGGWESLTDDEGQEFVNQGDCVSYYASDGKTRGPKK